MFVQSVAMFMIRQKEILIEDFPLELPLKNFLPTGHVLSVERQRATLKKSNPKESREEQDMLFGFNAAEVFDIAIRIEENGKSFYTKAADRVDNPEVKALFQQLAREEETHKAKFLELKAMLPPQAKEPTVPDMGNELALYIEMMAKEHIFHDAGGVDRELEAISSVSEALRLAIQFEKDSVIFFISMKEATDDTKGQHMIDLLIKEEQAHVKRLSLALRQLQKH